jgi:hypothetical protein
VGGGGGCLPVVTVLMHNFFVRRQVILLMEMTVVQHRHRVHRSANMRSVGRGTECAWDGGHLQCSTLYAIAWTQPPHFRTRNKIFATRVKFRKIEN